MNDTLEHHGILGMKWGVRRYQNKDGTWTEEGKEHRVEGGSQKSSEPTVNEGSETSSKTADQTVQDISKKILTEREMMNMNSQRSINAAKTGLSCIKAARPWDGDDFDPESKMDQEWFLIEDQTFGLPQIADLANQGYDEKEINKMLSDGLEAYENSKYAEGFNGDKGTDVSGLWYLNMSGYGDGWNSSNISDYIRECANYAKDEAKHSDTVSDFLMHYGVKGQSWGKRNYQFEDGSLTEEGKERYSKGLTRSGASVFRSNKPKIGQQVWTAKRSMTKVGDLPEETKEKLLERVRQARQGGAKDDESGIPGMTRTVVEAKRTEMTPEEWEKLRSTTPKSLGSTQEMVKTDLSELSPEEKEKLRKKRAAAIKPVEPKKAVTMSDSSEDILSHHGILGMKWGIRRYQNADGSLTAAGRKRYGVDENDGQRSSSGQSSGSNSDTTTRTPAKSASEMTDQELNQALNRLRMEQQYNELTGAKSSNQYQNQQNFSTPPSNTGNLSNAELQAYITRLDMEKRYAQLTAPPPKEVSAGRKFFNEVVGPAINQVAKAYIVASLSKALGLKGDGDNGGGNNNNNNGGKKNNNDDSQYKSIKKELNDLKSMMGSQRKQDNGGNQKKESSRDSGSESGNDLPEPRSTETQKSNTHRDSIFSAARDAARNAREQRREREREQEREQRRQESREKRERRNAQWSAFLDGLDRQTGGSVDPVTKSYKTRAQSYFDSYLNSMGR